MEKKILEEENAKLRQANADLKDQFEFWKNRYPTLLLPSSFVPIVWIIEFVKWSCEGELRSGVVWSGLALRKAVEGCVCVYCVYLC